MSPATLPVEVGWLSADGSESGSVLIDWSRSLPERDRDWFEGTVRATAAAMHSRGKAYRFTPELLREEGIDAETGLAMVADVFAASRESGVPLAGYNAWKFDTPILQNALRRVGASFPPVEPAEVVDAMVVEWGRERKIPPSVAGETRRSWYDRVLNGKGRRVSLAACVQRYGLDGVDASLAHTAGGDCDTTRRLIEAMGALARGEGRVGQATLF